MCIKTNIDTNILKKKIFYLKKIKSSQRIKDNLTRLLYSVDAMYMIFFPNKRRKKMQ